MDLVSVVERRIEATSRAYYWQLFHVSGLLEFKIERKLSRVLILCAKEKQKTILVDESKLNYKFSAKHKMAGAFLEQWLPLIRRQFWFPCMDSKD